MNKFEIAKLYEKMSAVDFLHYLMTIPSVKNKEGVVQYIKFLLKKIKEYSHYRIISAIKGLNPFHKDSETDVTPEYYDYTKTKEFESEMKGLWKALDMTDLYLSETYQDLYDILTKFLDKDTASTIELTREGYFSYLDTEGNSQTVTILSDEQYEKMSEFARNDEYLMTLNFGAAQAGIVDEKYHVVYTDNPIVNRFLLNSILEQHKTQEEVEQNHDKAENLGKENEKQEEKNRESVKNININIGETEKPKWQKLDPENDHTLKESLFQQGADKLPAYTVTFTFTPALIKAENEKYYAVRLPGKFKNDNGQYETVAHTQGTDYIALIPKDKIRSIKNKTYECSINLAESFCLCDKDGKVVYKDKEKTKPYKMAGLSIADKFLLKRLLYEPQKELLKDKIVIDGEEMVAVRTEDGFRFAFSAKENRAVLLSYDGNEKEIVVPSSITVNGASYSLNEIKDNAFASTGIEKIEIPDSVIEIRNAVFQNCTQLKDVVLPIKLESMGNRAFFGCSALKSIEIPTSTITIGEDVFGECILENIKCNAGEHVYITNNMLVCDKTVIKAFTQDFPEKVTIPDGVTRIGGYAFEEIPGKVLVVPSTINKIGHHAFEFSEFETVLGMENVKIIENDAFRNSDITSVNLSRVSEIDAYAFSDTSIKNVELQNISKIGEYAFANNMQLEQVILDASTLKPEEYQDNAFANTNATVKWNNLTSDQKIVIDERKEKNIKTEEKIKEQTAALPGLETAPIILSEIEKKELMDEIKHDYGTHTTWKLPNQEIPSEESSDTAGQALIYMMSAESFVNLQVKREFDSIFIQKNNENIYSVAIIDKNNSITSYEKYDELQSLIDDIDSISGCEVEVNYNTPADSDIEQKTEMKKVEKRKNLNQGMDI